MLKAACAVVVKTRCRLGSCHLLKPGDGAAYDSIPCGGVLDFLAFEHGPFGHIVVIRYRPKLGVKSDNEHIVIHGAVVVAHGLPCVLAIGVYDYGEQYRPMVVQFVNGMR